LRSCFGKRFMGRMRSLPLACLVLLVAGSSTGTFAQGAAAASPAPELVLVDLVPDQSCNLAAVVRNLGGPLPASAGAISVEFRDKNGGALGTADVLNSNNFGTADLRSASGNRSATVSSKYEVDRKKERTFTAVLKGPAGIVTASGGTSLTRDVVCKRDLAIKSVDVTADCRLRIELKNVGKAPFVDWHYSALPGRAFERSIDGAMLPRLSLAEIDPTRGLARPGGTVVYEEPASVRAYKEYEYAIRDNYKDERNDSKKGKIKGACAGTPSAIAYDLAVTNLEVDAKCQVTAVIVNQGTAPVPPIDAVAQAYADSKPSGGYVIELSGLAPGATARRSMGFQVKSKAVDLKVRISHDKDSAIKDKDPSNNERVLKNFTCTPK
jgi:hypothetical protein